MDNLPDSGILAVWRMYSVPILFGVLSCFFIILSVVLLVRMSFATSPIQFSQAQPSVLGKISNQASESANLNRVLLVDIEGAVARPGIVSVPLGGRVEDALREAGGLTRNADSVYISQEINRAMKVVDGMKIYIPSKSDTSHNGDCAALGKIGDVAQSCGIVATLGKSSQSAASISINMASKSLLESLSGVGPVTAQKIIDKRPYQTLEELVSKKAVGQALYEKIKTQITL